MTAFEKLVGLLKNHCAVIGETNCMAAIGKKCTKEDCAKCLAGHLLSLGVTVKEPQKPLTQEEVKEKKAVWVENKVEDEDLYPALLCCRSYTYFNEFCINVGDDDGTVLLDNDKYGVAWRCWAEKPTEEERKAAEWEN